MRLDNGSKKQLPGRHMDVVTRPVQQIKAALDLLYDVIDVATPRELAVDEKPKVFEGFNRSQLAGIIINGRNWHTAAVREKAFRFPNIQQ